MQVWDPCSTGCRRSRRTLWSNSGVPDLHTTLKVDVDFSKKRIFQGSKGQKTQIFQAKKSIFVCFGSPKKQIFQYQLSKRNIIYTVLENGFQVVDLVYQLAVAVLQIYKTLKMSLHSRHYYQYVVLLVKFRTSPTKIVIKF